MTTFSKDERLCSRVLIDRLYLSGHRLMAFPYSVHWQLADKLPAADIPCQVLIAVSKRKFKHAVDRNRVKRLTRECYRQHKEQLVAALDGRHLVLSLNYIHNEVMDFDQLQHKFDKFIPQLIEAVCSENSTK